MLQPVFKDGEWDWRLVGVISEGVNGRGFRTHYGGSSAFHLAGRPPLALTDSQQKFPHHPLELH
jgi:hypothetical protein